MTSFTPPKSTNTVAGTLCCPDCGTVLGGVSTKVNRLEEELNRAHHELKRLRSQVAEDKAEITRQDKAAYTLWLEAHGKDSSKAVNRWGPGMQRALGRARKAGLKQDEILKAITTHARFPFLVFGKWSEAGSARDRKDALGDLFKDENRWGSMLELAETPAPKAAWRNLTRVPPRDPIVEFTDALEHANCSPKFSYDQQGNALCPAHDDTHKSLRFKEGEDGRVLVKCMASNCTPEAICAALGLRVADLFPNRKDG